MPFHTLVLFLAVPFLIFAVFNTTNTYRTLPALVVLQRVLQQEAWPPCSSTRSLTSRWWGELKSTTRHYIHSLPSFLPLSHPRPMKTRIHIIQATIFSIPPYPSSTTNIGKDRRKYTLLILVLLRVKELSVLLIQSWKMLVNSLNV